MKEKKVLLWIIAIIVALMGAFIAIHSFAELVAYIDSSPDNPALDPLRVKFFLGCILIIIAPSIAKRYVWSIVIAVVMAVLLFIPY